MSLSVVIRCLGLSNDLISEATGPTFHMYRLWAEGLKVCMFFMKIGSLEWLLWQFSFHRLIMGKIEK